MTYRRPKEQHHFFFSSGAIAKQNRRDVFGNVPTVCQNNGWLT
ncbi:hypothetical protein CKA32_001929 [Geitlerinema sp. FC II]|nr:hypothetical protein CKA32_001929 [Geitlerinema sp. FC II]